MNICIYTHTHIYIYIKKDRAAKAEALFQEHEDRAAARSHATLSRLQVILVGLRAAEAAGETNTEPSV